MNKKILKYQGYTIQYILIHKNVKNINIRIRDNLVFISLNKSISTEYIEKILISKWTWIKSKLELHKESFFPKDDSNYIEGESFKYLGINYNLKIIEDKNEKVELSNDLIVYSKNLDSINIKKLLDKWFENRLSSIIYNSLEKNYNLVSDYTHIYPSIKFRKMSSSWGNCRMPSGVMTFNKKIIHMPLDFIDYVMIHELVHLIHPNHSRNFYNLLDELSPNWRKLANLPYTTSIL